jgi:hypothetical protein
MRFKVGKGVMSSFTTRTSIMLPKCVHTSPKVLWIGLQLEAGHLEHMASSLCFRGKVLRAMEEERVLRNE